MTHITQRMRMVYWTSLVSVPEEDLSVFKIKAVEIGRDDGIWFQQVANRPGATPRGRFIVGIPRHLKILRSWTMLEQKRQGAATRRLHKPTASPEYLPLHRR